MAFDGIITHVVVCELKNNIINARIEKIYVPNKNEVYIHLHKDTEKLKLLISINPQNARIHLTKTTIENPEKARQFCMVLRKHLQGSKILEIAQHGCDRIVEITFACIDDFGDKVEKKLILEMMGKHSNIILVNAQNKIIDCIKYVDSSISSLREVLPAHEYIYPQNQEKANIKGMPEDEFTANVLLSYMVPSTTEPNIVTQLANRFEGFSIPFAKIIINKVLQDSTPGPENISRLYTELTKLMHCINENMVSLKTYENDYHIAVGNYGKSSSKTPISEFLDNYYLEKLDSEKIKNAKIELQKEIINIRYKQEKNKKRVLEILAEANNMEKYKEYGELLTSNMYKISQGMKEITVDNFYNNNESITITLNPSYSPSKNVQQYFKKYTKLKNAIEHANIQEKEYSENINYLESILFAIDEATTLNEVAENKEELIKQGYLKEPLKTKKKIVEKSKPYEYEKDGIKILVGKNNLQNEKLTLKDSNKNHTWLHTKSIHGSHVIIQSEDISKDVLLYAASLAVLHSKAKDSSSKTEVDYTKVKNVHKLPGSKPGMVTYTDYKTIII